jgi:YggT family protein
MIPMLKLLIHYFFVIYPTLLIIEILLSWVPHNYYHPLVRLLKTVTEPYLNLFRQLPLQYGGIDFSPILAFLVLGPLEGFIWNIFQILHL